MISDGLKTCFAATFGGSVLFGGLVAFCILVAQFNADVSPSIPWFPLPVLGAVFGVAWWCDRRWDIGLNAPLRAPLGLVVAFAVLSMIAARAVSVLESSYHGVTKQFPAGPEETGAVFLLIYWLTISVALSTSSELCFRGIMQAQLRRYLPLWPAIAIVVLFNTFSHPWDSLWVRFFGVMAILFAWSWLRYISGSLKATILAHIGIIMGLDLMYWFIGPVDYAQVSRSTLLTIAAVGCAALVASVYLSRRITNSATRPADQILSSNSVNL